MYIFLDVDGVLNKKEDWRKKVYSINPDCVEAFCKLIKGLDSPKVVLSSSWRNGIARDGSSVVRIEDLHEAMWRVGIMKMDKTPVAADGSRSREIAYYLKHHDEDDYLILDDDSELFELGSETPHLYLTNPETGLTDADVVKIIKKVRGGKRKSLIGQLFNKIIIK